MDWMITHRYIHNDYKVFIVSKCFNLWVHNESQDFLFSFFILVDKDIYKHGV